MARAKYPRTAFILESGIEVGLRANHLLEMLSYAQTSTEPGRHGAPLDAADLRDRRLEATREADKAGADRGADGSLPSRDPPACAMGDDSPRDRQAHADRHHRDARDPGRLDPWWTRALARRELCRVEARLEHPDPLECCADHERHDPAAEQPDPEGETVIGLRRSGHRRGAEHVVAFGPGIGRYPRDHAERRDEKRQQRATPRCHHDASLPRRHCDPRHLRLNRSHDPSVRAGALEPAPHSDAALVSAWQGGDQSAGEALVRRHIDAVVRFFANKVDCECDDLVQATFLLCAEAGSRFEGRSSFRVFLLGIANNLWLKHLRRRYGRGRPLDLDTVSVRDLSSSPSSVVARNESQQRLLDALRLLPVNEQAALEGYYWDGLTAPELAEVLAIPEGTLRTRLRSARARIAKHLRREQLLRSAHSRPASPPATTRQTKPAPAGGRTRDADAASPRPPR